MVGLELSTGDIDLAIILSKLKSNKTRIRQLEIKGENSQSLWESFLQHLGYFSKLKYLSYNTIHWNEGVKKNLGQIFHTLTAKHNKVEQLIFSNNDVLHPGLNQLIQQSLKLRCLELNLFMNNLNQ